MRYYTAQQTLELLNKELPHNPLPFDLPQLADLCRQGILTPVFPYQGFISVPVDYEDNGRPIHATGAIEPYDSYLYSNELIKLIDGYADKLELWTASTPQGLHNLDFYSRPMRHTDDDIDPITFMVRLENILFAADDVQNYITLQYFDDLTTPEQQRIIELESEVTDLKKKLRQQADTPANDDKELEANTQAAVTRLLNVLFHMSGHDLSAHSGTLNKNIYDYSRHPSIETPITKVFISDWIKRVQQLRIDTKEKQNTGVYDRHMT